MELKFIADEYKLDRRDYLPLQKIRQGGFDNIILLRNTKTQTDYVAKVLDRDKYNQDMIDQEIYLRIKANHSAVNEFIGYYDNNYKSVFLVMKKSTNNSLYDFFKGNLLDNTSRQIILVGVAYGMMYLHKNNIFHKSLTPESILLDKNFYPQITDIEFEKFKSQEYKIPIYTAPEVFEKKYFTEKSDVYSFGIIMFQLITNTNPFPQILNGKMAKDEFVENVVSKNLRPQIPADVKLSFSELLNKCWSNDPDERPSFNEIYQKLYYDFNYYLDDVDVKKLFQYVSKIEIDEKREKSLLNERNLVNNHSKSRKINKKIQNQME